MRSVTIGWIREQGLEIYQNSQPALRILTYGISGGTEHKTAEFLEVDLRDRKEFDYKIICNFEIIHTGI